MGSEYDYVVVGAGIYGLYLSRILADRGFDVLLVECESRPFMRASYVNQARVHNGYHYPRSYSTAIKSARYFDRFCEDFSFAINRRFKKIYAISSKYSLTSGDQFEKFCRHANIPCEEVNPDKYFRRSMVQAAFETLEYAFDAQKICTYLETAIYNTGRVHCKYGTRITGVTRGETTFSLQLSDGETIVASNVVNCTYAAINQLNKLFGFETFRIKYEIAEVILCHVSDNLRDMGITVMDGPFFSVMPFGDTGYHTLTAVTFTPHKTCYDNVPRFNCQAANPACTPDILQNCNTCSSRPATAMPYMNQLAGKYLSGDFNISYESSVFAIKPILLASEIDDSRPTLIRNFSKEPGYTAVLSGKINTIYDLEEALL